MTPIVRLATVAAAATALLAGCGTQHHSQVYGENGHCFYVDSPREVDALWADNRCPRGWQAWPMPTGFYNSHRSYYQSSAYVNRYVPTERRVIVHHITVLHAPATAPRPAAPAPAPKVPLTKPQPPRPVFKAPAPAPRPAAPRPPAHR